MALALSLSPKAHAHPADLSTQVILTIEIAPGGVTHTVMIPLRQALVDVYGEMSYADYQALDPAQADLRLRDYHTQTNTVAINGIDIAPIIEGRTVTTLAVAIPEAAIPQGQFIDHAFLSYSAHYACEGHPSRVELVWGAFAFDTFALEQGTLGQTPTAQTPRSPLVAELNAMGKTTLKVFSPSEPAITWHGQAATPPADLLVATPLPPDPNTPRPMIRESQIAPRKLPQRIASLLLLTLGIVLAIVLAKRRKPVVAGAVVLWTLVLFAVCFPLDRPMAKNHVSTKGNAPPPPAPLEKPDDAQAIEMFTILHRNIYSAFDYNADSDIYDALALSVAGPELEAIYNNVYASLILREEGGAVGKVQAIDWLETDVAEPDTEAIGAIKEIDADDLDAVFAVRCRWTVSGLVSHFGHTHERLNAFDATYTLAPINGSWRIVATTMHAQERLDRPGEDSGLPNLDDLLGEEE